VSALKHPNSKEGLLAASNWETLTVSPRVLLIDDEPAAVLPLIALLRHLDVQSIYTPDMEAALDQLENQIDLIIMDWIYPEYEGNLILETLGNLGDAELPPIIIYSGLESHHFEIPHHTTHMIEGIWKKPMRLNEMAKELNRKLYFGSKNE
tara:strand:+ start:3779 stop:4231 length:453 start_codon:yes stop_codon:yes gene_type:complete